MVNDRSKLALCMPSNFSQFFCHLLTVLKLTFSKKLSGTLPVSNILDPDQAQCSVGPDLGPNCLKRSTADE